MITMKDWHEATTNGTKLYFGKAGQVYEIPRQTAVAYDTTLEDYCICLATKNTTFKEIFKTEEECVEFIVSEIRATYGGKHE